MPKTAGVLTERRDEEAAATHVDELVRRGRRQGYLMLRELRNALEQANVTPAEARSILRELSDEGVRLGNEVNDPATAAHTTAVPAAAGDGLSEVEPAEVTHAVSDLAEMELGPDLAVAELDDAELLDEIEDAEPQPERRRKGGRQRGRKDRRQAAGAELTAVADDDSEADLDDQTSVMGDSVHTYLKSIGRTSLLTAEQEVDLAKRIEAGLFAEHKLESETGLREELIADLEAVAADGRRAKAHMLEANLRLVVSVAKKYSDRGLSLLDVVQEGNLGLIRAVEKFDYTKGYKFSTYAMWWIRQAIQRGFADSARTIRLPVHVLEMLSKLSRVERDMHQRLGREPTPEELAVELDRTPDQIEELLRTSRQPISLDSTIGEDGETSIGDLIEDVDAPEASELVDRQLMADQLRHALDALTPREATIMAMRFGLYDGNPHTLDEIGKALGLTRERIRQLEKQSLSKLRHPSRAQPLLEYAV
ncbi:MAG: RNA polymerase sigma factor [Nocardiopsaceae bacterium]|jgi:RNA polymerase primary sigma factor|nr:RNA polymerase sigma factor [Nocardiopsaceae bacterium]